MKELTFVALYAHNNMICEEVYAEVEDDCDLKEEVRSFLTEVRIDHPTANVRFIVRDMDGEVVAKFTEEEFAPAEQKERTEAVKDKSYSNPYECSRHGIAYDAATCEECSTIIMHTHCECYD